jgi:hypothetical protein
VPTHLALGSSVGLSDEELSWLNGWQEAPAELFELCFTVGLAGLVNRMHATFHTDLDARTAQRVEQLDIPDDTVPDPRH